MVLESREYLQVKEKKCLTKEKRKNLTWWHRHRLEVMRLVYSGEAEGEDVWGDLGETSEGLRPAPGRYQRSQRTTLPPYMSVEP